VDKDATLSSRFDILVLTSLILARITSNMAFMPSVVVMVVHRKRVSGLGEPKSQVQGSDYQDVGTCSLILRRKHEYRGWKNLSLRGWFFAAPWRNTPFIYRGTTGLHNRNLNISFYLLPKTVGSFFTIIIYLPQQGFPLLYIFKKKDRLTFLIPLKLIPNLHLPNLKSCQNMWPHGHGYLYI
jgi:hypothetical protein